MPRWLSHSRPLIALRRRYNLNVPVAEMLTGILPTVQTDKHWQDDTLDVWGLFSQGVGDGVNLECAALLAGNREVLVHRIDVWSEGTSSTIGVDVHIFTPLQNYNPFGIAVDAIQFGWCQTKANNNDVGQLGATIGASGRAAGLQVIVINAIPVTTIGPVYSAQSILTIPGGLTTVGTSPIKAWSAQDPPLRIKPFATLCVQVLAPTAVNHFLNANFWYSERGAQGDVG